MKKLIALVLTVAMLVTCFAFSASAETTAPSVTLSGPETVTAGSDIVVKVNVNDTEAGIVGGVQGTINVTGATVTSVTVYDQLAVWNNAENALDTIYTNNNGEIKFAAVNKLDATVGTSAAWFELNLKAPAEGNVKVELSDIKAADTSAKALTIATGDAYDVAVSAATAATLNKVGVLEQVVPNDQGIVVNASITLSDDLKAEDIKEYGVVFYPTSLLENNELTYNYDGAVAAKIEAGAAKFEQYLTDGEFNAVLHFDFADDEKAAKFLGTKVSSRVYYIVEGDTAEDTDDVVYYSKNKDNSDSYIQNGVAAKAALRTILDYANPKADAKTDSTTYTAQQYKDASTAITISNDEWYANRKIVLIYAVELAKAEKTAAAQ